LAFLLIIAMTVIAEVLETISYIMGAAPDMSGFLTYAIEIWEYVVTVSMIIALVQESTLFMLPFIGEMFVLVIMMLILVFQLLFCLVAPYSTMAEQFFVDGRYTFLQREKKLFAIFIFVAFFTSLAVWFLNIGLTTYMYFDFVNEKRNRRTRRTATEQAPVLVQPNAIPPNVVVTPVTESFPNPNFVINSDEEDDEVFQNGVQPHVSVA
uniref:Protein TEX261 n=1 Tax=Heligmosomoides polygyrus TaxID=6339 RepID=A0A183GLK9_HELPZ